MHEIKALTLHKDAKHELPHLRKVNIDEPEVLEVNSQLFKSSALLAAWTLL